MSSRIPEEIIQEVRDRTDIVEVVSSYVSLKRSGANHQGLCPFHSEKTPSFNVNSPRQIFHCFGCGVGGNVFSFLMQIEGLAFPEAVRRLGEKVGVEIPDEQLSPAEEKRRQEFEKLARINEVAAEFYHQLLLDSDEGGPARRYLRQRGYDSETVKAFQLGFAPERWEALAKHLQEKGFDLKLVRDKIGLIREGKEGRGDYDLFRKRLLFPIHDIRGQVVAFGGRVLDDSLPKYINSPESPIYNKSRILYGLSQAKEAMRREGSAIIVEGYFDQMALYRAGFAHAVATCGTALTGEHGKLLKRYAEKIYLLFDSDKAGIAATFRSMEVLLPAGLSVAVVTLGEGEDPDSFLAAHGEEKMAARLAEAQPVLDYFADVTLAQYGEGAEGKARAVELIIEKFRLLKSDIERDLYLKALAERTGLDETTLRRKMKVAPVQRSSSPPQPAPPVRNRTDNRQEHVGDKAQKSLLRLMLLKDPEYRKKVREGGVDEFFMEGLFRDSADYILQREDSAGALSGDILDHAQLSAEQIELVSSLILVNENEAEELDEISGQIFTDCCRAVERKKLAGELTEIDIRVKEALAQGEEISHLQMQRIEINRKLKKN